MVRDDTHKLLAAQPEEIVFLGDEIGHIGVNSEMGQGAIFGLL